MKPLPSVNGTNLVPFIWMMEGGYAFERGKRSEHRDGSWAAKRFPVHLRTCSGAGKQSADIQQIAYLARIFQPRRWLAFHLHLASADEPDGILTSQ